MAQPRVERAALELIRSIPTIASADVLELGAGDGRMLERLAEAFPNARVRGTTFRARGDDYIRTRDYPERIRDRIDDGVDLNRALPYPDASFDVVYSVEVLEHVESHRTFLTEAARVLRRGGTLVLTTPNVHRLLSRVQFAFTGLHGRKRRLIPPSAPLAQMEEYHCHLADFPTLHWLLWRGGLRVQAMAVGERKAASLALLSLYGAVWWSTRRQCLRKAENAEDLAGKRDLARWMTSPALLTSEQIVLRAVKSARGEHATPTVTVRAAAATHAAPSEN